MRRVTQAKVAVLTADIDTYIFLYRDSSLNGGGARCKQQGPMASLLGFLSGFLFSQPSHSPSPPLPGNLKKGQVYVIDTATCSMKLARFMSRSERPAHSWVLKVIWT